MHKCVYQQCLINNESLYSIESFDVDIWNRIVDNYVRFEKECFSRSTLYVYISAER